MKKSRVTGIEEDEVRRGRPHITYDESSSSRFSFSSRTGRILSIAAIVLLIAGVAGGVYYWLYNQRSFLSQSRLQDVNRAGDEISSKKITPERLPDHPELNRAIELYKQGYLKPADSAFRDIVESGAEPVVKAYALIYRGIMADDGGKFTLATDFLQRALKLDPKNFYAHYNLAIVMRHRGMYKQALQQLEKARALRPDALNAEILKGQLEYQAEDFQSAEETLERASDSRDPLALYNLGMVYKKEGKLAEAKAAFTEAYDRAGAGEIAYKAASQVGIIYATQGDYNNAREHMKRAVALAPQNPKYYYNLALIEYRTGETEAALKNLKKAVSLGREDTKTYVYVARLFEELGRTKDAEDALLAAREIAPHDSLVLTKLADMQIRLKKWESAIENLERLLETSAKSGDKAHALYNLGLIYRELKNFEKAESYLNRARSLDSLNEDVLIALGRVYEEKGSAHKAIDIYRQALKVNPDNLKLLRELSMLYVRLGLLTEAEDSLRRLVNHPLKKDHDVYWAYFALGDIYAKRKSYDSALSYYAKSEQAPAEDLRFKTYMASADTMLKAGKPSAMALNKLEKAIALKPGSLTARLLLAKILLKKGSVRSEERAIEEIVAILETGEDRRLLSKAHTLRGILNYKNGLYMKALDDFSRALELDPSNTEAFQNKRAAASRLENG